MPTDSLLIIGAGGHAKVVIDALVCGGCNMDVEICDDDNNLDSVELCNFPVKTPVPRVAMWPDTIHVAIGNNGPRKKYCIDAEEAKKHIYTVYHPSAVISASAKINNGNFIAANSVLGPDVIIDKGVIINHGAIIDHDCRICSWVHIAPGAVLGGAVTLGEGVFIGSGAVIQPGISIGEWATVGSGAVVTKDVSSGNTVIGIPAK